MTKEATKTESVNSENRKDDGLNFDLWGDIEPADLTRTFDFGNHDQFKDGAKRDRERTAGREREIKRQEEQLMAVKETNSHPIGGTPKNPGLGE